MGLSIFKLCVNTGGGNEIDEKLHVNVPVLPQ